jgi:hypothetical protein
MGISEFQEWCVDDIFPYIRYMYMAKTFWKRPTRQKDKKKILKSMSNKPFVIVQ